jgi:hypothetical protein
MSTLSSQQINAFYEQYKTIALTFSQETIVATGLVAKQIYLKCMGDFWPCVLYASSFETAKIVANIKAGLVEKLQTAKNTASIRFCFKQSGNSDAIFFFVNVKSIGFTPYGNSSDVAMFTFQYIQRPPDDLIEILGRFLSVNDSFSKRRSERLTLTPELMRKLQLHTRETVVSVQGASKNCILRDISLFGAKVIMMGTGKESEDVVLRVSFTNPAEHFMLKGRFIRAEMVEGREDLCALGVAFEEAEIPLNYKIRINDYLNLARQARPERVPSRVEA